MQFRRYGIYYTPPPGALADFGARWLGWDIATGQPAPHPAMPGLPLPLPEITAKPRKYGLHGTIKPPFALAGGHSAHDLHAAFTTLCSTLAPVRLDGLHLSQIGRFLALKVDGPQTPLSDLAAHVVQQLDRFRAPPSEQERARRRTSRLSPRQEALLTQWGYPYVLDEFRFHITLTGSLPRDQVAPVKDALAPHITPLLPTPFEITDLTLVGEDDTGMFHQIQRCALTKSRPST